MFYSEFAFRPFCEIPVSWGHFSIVITAGTVQSSCTLLNLTFSCDLSSEKRLYFTYCVFVFLLLLWRWGPPPALFRPACAGLLFLGRSTMCAWPQDRADGFLGSVWWQTMVTLSSSLNTGKRYENFLNMFFFFLLLLHKRWNLTFGFTYYTPNGMVRVQYSSIKSIILQFVKKNNWQYKKTGKCNAHSFERGNIVRKQDLLRKEFC